MNVAVYKADAFISMSSNMLEDDAALYRSHMDKMMSEITLDLFNPILGPKDPRPFLGPDVPSYCPGDDVEISLDGGGITLDAGWDSYAEDRGPAHLSPSEARATAHHLLELADALDGGE